MIGPLLALLALISVLSAIQDEPGVRIGLDQNARNFTVRSADPFVIERGRTRSAKFSIVITIGREARTYKKEDLQYRMAIERDDGHVLILPMPSRIRIRPGNAPLELDGKTYRGELEIFGNARNTYTIVNELSMEEYLLGVVPNELNPKTFNQLEALKAQAIAARTYIVRNRKEYAREGFDICDTDQCQVYNGLGTEDPLASQAVAETRGVIAVYGDQPINALYTSTCGGRTENSENVFDEKLPYLVSTACLYKHPTPQSFNVSRYFPEWKEAVLRVADVASFSDARKFLGVPGEGEPASIEKESLATFIREVFFPEVQADSDVSFLMEQGVLSPDGEVSLKEVLFRLIEKKNAFEWQQGDLISWDGQTMYIRMGGQILEFRLSPEAPIFQRIGDEFIALQSGSWIGGEALQFRAVGGEIQMLAFRSNAAGPSADRYSRVARWQVRKTRQELDTAFRPLNIGAFVDLKILERGASDRPIQVEVVGTLGKRVVRGFRVRSLLGLRESLFYVDRERNSQGELLGVTFYGRGWGHGVGFCQVGAYGMAMDGATVEEILKKYYRGIELKKIY